MIGEKDTKRIRGQYRQNVKRRNKWISQFIEIAQIAAE
jgi:hypothetical protein